MISAAADLLAGLDPEQQQVATGFGSPMVVIAGAGTGKTRALTHRIAYGSAIGAYDPGAVLAVTFTTRAAGELRSRLRALGIVGAQARTFHSAALRQAQYFWPRAYGSPLPQVSSDRIRMLAAASRQLKLDADPATLRDLMTEVAWAKVTNVSPGEYAELAAASNREVAGLSSQQVGQVLGRYESVKNADGVIDFDDILLCALALLSEHSDIAAEVRNTYRHLLVDEYQDVNPVQQALLDLWWGEGGDHCFVGDPAQTIHSFAGASPVFLTGFLDRHPDARLVQLVRDYRSSPQVVALANLVSRKNSLGAITLLAQADPGPEPEIRGFGTEADEAEAVAAWLLAQHEAGVPWREQAVLYRVHAQSPVLEAALADQGVPFTIKGGEGFYERFEVRQALASLADLAGREPQRPAVDTCREVVSRFGWTPQPPNGQGRVRERWESLSAVLALAEDLAAEVPEVDVAALVAELDQRAQAEHPLNPDGVTLSTLHSAKGLEWSSVAIVGLQEGTLPLSLVTGPEQLAEEARLFYVGITRARRAVLITFSRTRRGGGTRRPSRFLDGIAAKSVTVAVPVGKPKRRGSALSATCRACGRTLGSGAERKLRRHAACPSTHDEDTYARLVAWRLDKARNKSMPAFVIFTDATLMAIAEDRPRDEAGLLAVPGVGRAKLAEYGAEVLQIVTQSSDSDAGPASRVRRTR